ncbi:aminopeptidase P family protein [Parapedobacter soli]|uniref:aminopeptidase P family protein n=1 Tax=Parapedobacter soli TaxID=416955 RepID=UPI0021CADE70|nr:aminopeptidase P family protein [Parapedobacter soli]
MTYGEKLAAIRGLMKEKHIDAYLIPSSDPHVSEYLPDRYKCIAWASGFTGSAGTLAITQSFAGLWTDSRYFVQAREQLAGSGYELVELTVQHAAEYADWLAENLPRGTIVAFDGWLMSAALAAAVQQRLLVAGIEVINDIDLLTPIWHSRPALPQNPVYLLEETITGETTASKLARVRVEITKSHVDAHLISSLDDIAWLLNMRGSDVVCNPVALAFLLVTPADAILFVDQVKLSPRERAELLAGGVEIADYAAVEGYLRRLSGKTFLLDPRRTCSHVYDILLPNVRESSNPTTRFKAVKNDVEIAHIRETMVKDGVALTRFFKWLEETMGKEETVTELSIAERLRQFRSEQSGFVGESFDTIAGYRAHGALPHYKATTASDSELQPNGLLLIDSGGQYRTGTTDITRVVSLGNCTAEERVDYTLVLKAMIEGCTAVFPRGTRGYQIDAITRKPLWDELRNYGHGTGHGVGFFLNVHEGPHTFNGAAVDVPVELGMVTSIEPGLYREGVYGIRIENLVLSVGHADTSFGSFVAFETLTICYIDTQLVDRSLLDTKHVTWLNAYHEMVYRRLEPYLTAEEQLWLAKKTKAI